jgi:hypothetical protein
MGEVELDLVPEQMMEIFRRFDEIANGQMLSFLDEIEAEIARLGIRFAAGDEDARRVGLSLGLIAEVWGSSWRAFEWPTCSSLLLV